MSRKTIVLVAAVFLLATSATVSPVRAKDPNAGLGRSFMALLLVFDGLRPEPYRPKNVRFIPERPVMPVDYSYDHLVDQLDQP